MALAARFTFVGGSYTTFRVIEWRPISGTLASSSEESDADPWRSAKREPPGSSPIGDRDKTGSAGWPSIFVDNGSLRQFRLAQAALDQVCGQFQAPHLPDPLTEVIGPGSIFRGAQYPPT